MDELGFEYIMDNLEVLTPGGHRLKRDMVPFGPGREEDMRQSLSLTEKLLSTDAGFRRRLAGYLSSLKDISGSLVRACRGIPLHEVEMFEIKNDLLIFDRIYNLIKHIGLPPEYIVMPVPEVYDILNIEGESSSFFIYSSYSPRLNEIRTDIDKTLKMMERVMSDHIKKMRETSGMDISMDGKAYIKKGDRIPEGFYLVKDGLTKSTIKVIQTEEYSRMERRLKELREEEEKEEYRVREHLTKEIMKHESKIRHSLDASSHLDLLLAKANLAVKLGLTMPEITDDLDLLIDNGFHPYVRELLEENGVRYQPVSIRLQKGVAILTGANMGGKSVTLKMVGLAAKMASYGLYVPADHARLPLFDFIYLSREGDSPENGLSSFGNAMAGLSRYLKKQRGLFLLDELTQGTNPPEGKALLLSIIEYLAGTDNMTFITTHYEGIYAEGVKHYRVKGLKDMPIEEVEKLSLNDRLRVIRRYMDYSLEAAEYGDVPQDAINIAYLMGVDVSVIERARNILHELD